MVTNYLVYYQTKKLDEYGMATCGFHKIVHIEIEENETRIEWEHRAIKEWQKEMYCGHLDIELE